ncbi:MAG: glycosyltransferase [Candidatus Eremiobacteraeota bacterium]|nr:glycosyltransferase [Candidatus Eremiobacteraeota bacterium]
MIPFDALPPLGERVRTIVIVPARDEADRIGAALRALAMQRTLSGEPLDARSYETIVFANTCTDATARIVRDFANGVAATHPVHVVEADLEPGAHVGTARRILMDAAAERFRRAGRASGWIASTDADTVVASDWIAAMRAEALAGADAVMGFVDISRSDRSALSLDAARLYDSDLAYRSAVADVECALDPVAWDPAPRHAFQYAASLAVSVDAYVRAGGLPALPRGEDSALYSALLRVDARVRHSLRMRVDTSPRATGRVEGGFANFIRLLHDAVGPEQWLVEHPEETLQRIRARAALRRYHTVDADRASAYRSALDAFELDFASFALLYDASATFGVNFDRFEADALARGVYATYGRVPVARATALLRSALAAPSRSAIRTSVASGAG